jgi:hypothetical protein
VIASLLEDSLWEDAGRRVASRLDHVFAAVVAGRDARSAALAALGIARMQSARRRVAVADLVGDNEVLQSLVTDDDVHGIVDNFVYGISLNRISRPVQGFPNLFILPSGSEPVAQEEVFRNRGWRRLSGGFQEVGALLLLVTVAGTPGLNDLIANTDGVVVAGTDFEIPGSPRTIATVAPQRASAPLITPERGTPSMEGKPASAPVLTPERATPIQITGALARGVIKPARRMVPIALGLLAASAIAIIAIARLRPDADEVPASTSRHVASTPAVAGNNDENLVPVVNPDDAAIAVGWSVLVVAHNTEAGAMLTLRQSLQGIGAATFSPVRMEDGAEWYQVYAGAFASRPGADSLLTFLRENGQLQEGLGQVSDQSLRVAIRLETGLTTGQAAAARSRYFVEGIPAYVLRQDDGTASVFTGAYATEADASSTINRIRATYPEVVLAFRTGRP